MNIMKSDLLNNYTDEYVFMNLSIENDGYGGYVQVWNEGAKFDAVVTEDSSMAATSAGLEFHTTFYGVKVAKDVPLAYHTVFKRLSDSKIFRIRNSEGLKSPSFSPLDMKLFQAEEYDISETAEEEKEEKENG